MFNIITWFISVGFPTLATYKALKGNDLTLMRPWLMYWAVLKLIESAESLLSPLLDMVLFYSWFRTFFAVWLVSHGAVELWNSRIDPFLTCYEPDLDSTISKWYQKVYPKLVGTPVPEPNPAATEPPAASSLFSIFRTPVSTDAMLEALCSAWSKPTSTEQATKQRSYLQAMLDVLDKDTEEFVAVDNVPTPSTPQRKGWFW